MVDFKRRSSAAPAAGALAVLAVVAASPPAHADHNNPTALCNEKFKGTSTTASRSRLSRGEPVCRSAAWR
jgi:hypothetical protein